MSQKVIDSQNVVNSLNEAPDKLRAEIGRYYSSMTNLVTGDISIGRARNHSSDKIFRFNINHLPDNDQTLIPVKKSEIKITGRNTLFRDFNQWETYVRDTIIEDQEFIDHTFSLDIPNVTNKFVKNFHHPNYEDNSKSFASNQLLNYNLISYPHQSETVNRIGYLKTAFDNLNTNDIKIETLMSQFSNKF